MADFPSRSDSPQAHAESSLRRSNSFSHHSQRSSRSHESVLSGGHSERPSQDTTQSPRRREMSPNRNEPAWRKRSPTINSSNEMVMDTKHSWESHRLSNRSSPSTSNELDRTKAGLLDGMGDDDEEAGLKYEHRNRRGRRKRGNTFPLGKIPLGHLTPTQEKKIADLAVIKSSLVNVLLIALWYIFSLSISLVSGFLSLCRASLPLSTERRATFTGLRKHVKRDKTRPDSACAFTKVATSATMWS